jgi:hypothetical protein
MMGGGEGTKKMLLGIKRRDQVLGHFTIDHWRLVHETVHAFAGQRMTVVNSGQVKE